MCRKFQGIPREVWLDKSGKQLVQWPIQEIESLRENQVTSFPKLLNGGSLQEIKGITAAQVSFKCPPTICARLKNISKLYFSLSLLSNYFRALKVLFQ